MSDTPEAEDTKVCPDCGEPRPLSAFYRIKAKGYAGGYRYGAYCKAHTKERNAEARKKALEQGGQYAETIRKTNRVWAQQHPENARQNSASYRTRKGGQASAADAGDTET